MPALAACVMRGKSVSYFVWRGEWVGDDPGRARGGSSVTHRRYPTFETGNDAVALDQLAQGAVLFPARCAACVTFPFTLARSSCRYTRLKSSSAQARASA